ncbi:MAG: HDIG domain-containing protein, partial [Sporomusaceae bacterium]|jgi:putative nucleotidyltransferase with HDIG domain|nr:HDIG domain-containing protein [Sporomusaceae bacterium]
MKNKLGHWQQFTQNISEIREKFLTFRLILAFLFFLLYLIVLTVDFSNSHNFSTLEVGQVSERDIAAPRSISYIDKVATQNLEAEILKGVSDVYELDASVKTEAQKNVAEIFRAARQTLSYKTISPENTPPDEAVAESSLPPEAKKEILKKIITLPLPENIFDLLNTLDETQLLQTENYSNTILEKYLQRGVRENELESVRQNIAAEIDALFLSAEEKALLQGITEFFLKPNFLYNEQATKEKQETALQAVEPVRKTVKRDQTLVRRGDVVTEEQIRVMEELGFYATSFERDRILGTALFTLIVMLIAILYLYHFTPDVYQKLSHLILLGFILFLSLLIGKLASYYSPFIAPVAMGALLAASLSGARIGAAVCVFIALLFAIIGDADWRAAFAPLLSGMAGVYSLSISPGGHSLVRAGFFISITNFFVIAATGLIIQNDPVEILTQAAFGIASGFFSAVLTIGILPFLEGAFNITSSVKMMDLARPSHPLLQRLLLEAPGSYHHSVLVGNMAESAATKVGADAGLVRVGAYYHDIGKIKRPYFFAENQMKEANGNPHEKMSPSLSALVVISHVKDGVELCLEYKLPQAVINIVAQHHGTGLASFFYRRAAEAAFGELVEEADFRYEGPKPQTKEAAIIMLADSCEASVRSINKPTQTRIEAMVNKIIRDRLEDEQLSECDLTFKDLTTISEVFSRILSSMFHSRIEYPEDLKRKDKNEDPNKQPPEKNTHNQGNETNSGTGPQ